ncbi:MAG: response regulator [Pseudomonadota bacterium]
MNRPRLRVLIVDDSELQLSFFRELLADQPFELDPVRSGADALAAARRRRPDIVLLDIEMPQMSGLEVVQALRRDPATATIPVIMVSCHRDADPMEHAFLQGCNDYVTKPVHKTELLAKIGSLTGFAPAGALP